MASKLEAVLSENRTQIEAELVNARTELDSLRRQASDLEHVIARAEYALGLRNIPDASVTSAGHKARSGTLTSALIGVLEVSPGAGLTAQEIANRVNSSHAYVRRDGTQIGAGQVHAYVTNYPTIFDRFEGKIRLKGKGSESTA